MESDGVMTDWFERVWSSHYLHCRPAGTDTGTAALLGLVSFICFVLQWVSVGRCFTWSQISASSVCHQVILMTLSSSLLHSRAQTHISCLSQAYWKPVAVKDTVFDCIMLLYRRAVTIKYKIIFLNNMYIINKTKFYFCFLQICTDSTQNGFYTFIFVLFYYIIHTFN